MALFQKSVLNKYLKGLDEKLISTQYETFKNYFLNPEIQDNIRASKEEQFQATFLNELFVKILGYTLNPNTNYNLTTEYKNVKNAKKADGAILQDGKAIGVIELKGMNTTNLDKIESQAFGYKNNQPDAVYVVTSNFEKIRFYIDNAVDFEEFNLFHLSLERFKTLYLCLAKDNIFINLPKQINDSSLEEEQNVTKKLYKDYSSFKQQLFQSIVELNPDFDKLLLFKKTQKLLDRFLFIFFAEDGGLLPPNSIRSIIEQWIQLRDELDAYTPLYNRFKKYFGYMNTGHKGKKHDIFAYNGGLFAPDEILDNIKIDDTILYISTQKLSGYDFKSEVDVNILGHIFEHSLNEIEEITAELEGKTIDKSKTKRKKDGVFYTPKYITKYIVENTVGKLCEAKKTALKIDEAEYNKSRKGRKKATLKKLKQQLDDYRNWLLNITICDPACGSGAFLNQALEFLIEEHTYIDELETKLFGGGFIFPNVENTILENNLYGVDINEESVDIAKLSLWLRSAKPNRKLNSLNNNIKCGNSLIDDPKVAGDKAFDWKKEFPKVFENGGFDVVIGNPPYVRQELLGEIKPFLELHYKSFAGTADLFTYFYEKGTNIIRKNGLLSFITNDFNKTKSSTALRTYLKKNTNFITFDDFSEIEVFKGTTTYPVILTFSNQKSDVFQYCKFDENDVNNLEAVFNEKAVVVKQVTLNDDNWTFKSENEFELFQKIDAFLNVKSLIGKSFRGIVTGFNEAFIIDNSVKNKIINESPNDGSLIKPLFEGKDLKKWKAPDIDKLMVFTRRGTVIDDYPAIKNWLSQYQERLTPRNTKGQKIGRKAGKYEWFEIQDSVEYYKLFEHPKIIFPNLQNSNKFAFDESGAYINAPAVILPTDDKSLLAILNSKLIWYFLNQICVVRSGGYIEVKPQYFEQIPIAPYQEQKTFLTEKAESQIEKTDKINKKINRFLKRLTDNLNIEKPSKKLQSFYDYDFKTFVKELKKKKVKLSLTEQDEWEDYFNAYTNEIKALQTEINRIDTEIDKMVYELYGLTEEEIKIVENS